MNMYISSIILIIISNTCYHIFQKKIDQNINPFVSLCVSYFIGIVFALTLYLLSGKYKNILKEISHVNIFTLLLGVAIAGLEIGFLAAYRANWSMSVAAAFSNAVITVILIPAGIIFFGEKFDLLKIAGITLCIGGSILLNLKK